MTGTKTLEHRSLERLKSLDALPDFPSQLHTAQTLCNHSARADMILRWLTTKLKATKTVRNTPGAWMLMASCLRLLPIEKITATLGFTFVELLQSTCAEHDLSADALIAVTQLWKLVWELGKSKGAAILALLAVDSRRAATVAGSWLYIVFILCSSGMLDPSRVASDALLDPALQLWNSKKQGTVENETFNERCAVPVTLLLTVLCKAQQPRYSKRKRESESATSLEEYCRFLESMLAKHTILPARATFFKYKAGIGSQFGRKRVEPAWQALQEALAPVLSSLLSDGHVSKLPMILDVAVRAVPMPSPRERFKERPWIEAMFLALSDCCATQRGELVNKVMVDMLYILHQHDVTLPAQTLTAVVKQYGSTSHGPTVPADWTVIASIAKLDAGVFTDASLAGKIFEDMSAQQQNESRSTIEYWRTNILSPIFKSYAQGRSLRALIDLWHDQLLSITDDDASSIWLDVAPELAALMEEAFTDAEALALLDKHSASLSHGQPHQLAPGGRTNLLADLVVLGSLVKGLKSDGRISKSQDKIENIRSALLQIDPSDAGQTSGLFADRLFAVLEDVMNIWFPSWAVQDGLISVADMGVIIIDSVPVKSAIRLCGKISSTRAAQSLVGAVCAKFCHYKEHIECANRCGEAMRQLIKQPITGARTLVKYAILWEVLSVDQTCTLALSLIGSKDTAFDLAYAALREARVPTQQLMDVVLLPATTTLAANGFDVPESTEARLMSAIRTLDTAELESTHCFKMVNALAGLPAPSMSEEGQIQLHQRLAAILDLSKHIPPQAQSNAECLDKILAFVQKNSPLKDRREEEASRLITPETLRLIDEIVHLWTSEKKVEMLGPKSKKALKHFDHLKASILAQNPLNEIKMSTTGASNVQLDFTTPEHVVKALEPLFQTHTLPSLEDARSQQLALKAITKDHLDGATTFSAHEVYHGVLHTVADGVSVHTRRRGLSTLEMILKTKPFMINQYAVELTVSVLHKVLQAEPQLDAIYLEVCRVFNALLGQYRSRLQGRFNLVVSLLQQLITSLFSGCKPPDQGPLIQRQARALARLLEFFCNPPHVRKSGKASELVDEARRAQVQAGQFAQYILHHYCALQLVASTAEGVKEGLALGIWAVITAIEANNTDGIKVLSAAMNHSERAILRSVYEDWKSSGRWES